jgi:phosphoenolpyruvate carboxykinase (ATP)
LPQEKAASLWNIWSDKAAHDALAKTLAGRFAENFKTFTDQASAEVSQAGPQAA